MRWTRKHRDRELDEEIRAHIRMATQERVRNGQDAERARAEVMKEFGSVALAMEDTRSVWGGQWLEQLAFDLRYAARTLARAPGFGAAAVLSLAIGIGATTALYSVLQHVAWQPLPYRDPAKLAIVWNLDPRLANPQTPASYPDWQDWRRQAQGFTGVAAFRNRPGFIKASEESPQVELHEVSADFLPLLGVGPALGRFWTDDEAARGQAAIISHHLWQQAFGGARDIVGRRMVVSQTPYEIVGVMPAEFHTPSMGTQANIRLSPADSMWAPFVPRPVQVANRGNRGLRILARLDGYTTIARAQRSLGALAAQLAEAYPDSNRNITVQVLPLVESLTGSVRPALMALTGAAGLFLLIACANVASLLLARGSARGREFATRAALGAGRARLVRQLMTESLVLAALGGCAGVALAAASLSLARQASTMLDIPRLAEAVLDLPVLLVALALSIATGLLFGLMPALRLAHSADRGGTTDPRGVRIRQLLIAGVTATTLVLVFSASMLLTSFQRLTASPRTAAERTYTFQTTINGTRWNHPPLDRQFCDMLLQRLRQIPNVEAAGLTTNLLQIGDNSGTLVTVVGSAPLPPERQPIAAYTMSDAGFFHLAGLPLREGRLFEAHDNATSPAVAIVNEAFVRAVSPDAPLLGRQVRLLGVTDMPLEVVGIVSDARPFRLGGQERPRLFYPYSQFASTRVIGMVRVADGGAPPVNAIRGILRELEPAAPMFEVRTVAELLSSATSAPRWGSVLLGAFAGMALLLASLGVMGVVGFVASQRTRECGIRIALGSTRAGVKWLVARQGMWPVAFGLIAGVAATQAAGRVIATNLVGIQQDSGLLLVADVLLLAVAAGIAVYLPATRVTKVDPALTLRCD
jgi:putative ABC transport system permease protein